MDSLTSSPSSAVVWAGRTLSGIAIAFLLFDAFGKLIRVAPVLEGAVKLGYTESTVFPTGILLLVGVILYLIPQSSMVGAIYLAAYLGGAVASHYRVGSPLMTHILFPVYVAAFLWGGLALRHPQLLSLLMGRNL